MNPSEPFDWDELLTCLADGRVVPVVGPDLLELEFDGQRGLLEDQLAARLAASLKVEVKSPRPTVGDVAFAYIESGGKQQKVYAQIRKLLDEQTIPIPSSLRKLAEITELRLFVSVTFDDLLSRAVEDVRGEHIRTLSFSPYKRPEDLPDSPDGIPTVFHLFGKCSPLPRDYAVTEEEVLEFLHSLQSVDRQPRNLFDALRENYVLLLGCRLQPWFARFLVRTVRNERLLTTVGAGELIVDQGVVRDPELVAFLKEYETNIFPLGDPVQFVDELHRRWQATQPDPKPAPGGEGKAIDADRQTPEVGSIFLSYHRPDQQAVRVLRDALKAAGLETWMDEHDIPPAAIWDRHIKKAIGRCAVFVPCLSRHAEGELEGYFRGEWNLAIERSERIADTVRFIWPIVLDDLPNDAENVPDEFRGAQWSKAAGGKPLPKFVSELRDEVRQIRRAQQRRQVP